MGTYSLSGYSREWREGQCEDNDPRNMTAEDSRHTSDTSQQQLAYGDQTSIPKERFEMMEEMDNEIRKEMFETMKEMDNKRRKEMFERMKEMDNKIRREMFETLEKMDNKIRREMSETLEEMDNKIRRETFKMLKEMDHKITENRTSTDPVNMVVHLPDNCNRAFPGRAAQLQHQEKVENEMLKEKNKKLEARCQELLAKMMAMHQHSEDINDPSRLSAVLQSYEMLRLQQWEKVRSFAYYRWTYDRGSDIIKKVFDACDNYIQQRTHDILGALDIPLGNDTLTKEMTQQIRKLFRQAHYQNQSMVYKKIVQEVAALTAIETPTEKQFLLLCCQIYSLLLLQDPPVKAQWKMNRKHSEHLEHVDRKDPKYWRNPSLLWPIMKCGEDIIVKGVVWD